MRLTSCWLLVTTLLSGCAIEASSGREPTLETDELDVNTGWIGCPDCVVKNIDNAARHLSDLRTQLATNPKLSLTSADLVLLEIGARMSPTTVSGTPVRLPQSSGRPIDRAINQLNGISALMKATPSMQLKADDQAAVERMMKIRLALVGLVPNSGGCSDCK